MKAAPRFELRLPLEERISLLMEDYAHFLENPEGLKSKLAPLHHRLGRERIDSWFNLIDAKSWRPFVSALLEEHYDRAYTTAASRRDGSVIGSIEVNLREDLGSARVIEQVDRLRRSGTETSALPPALHRT